MTNNANTPGSMIDELQSLCAELLEAYEIQLDELRFGDRLCQHARDVLERCRSLQNHASPADQDPPHPSDDDLDQWLALPEFARPGQRMTLVSITRNRLKRVADRAAEWGYRQRLKDELREPNTALGPTSVSEKPWKWEGWCDSEGHCWARAMPAPTAIDP